MVTKPDTRKVPVFKGNMFSVQGQLTVATLGLNWHLEGSPGKYCFQCKGS